MRQCIITKYSHPPFPLFLASLLSQYDRVKIDLGKVKNDDTYDAAQSDYTDSTITITFSALVIINPDYQNTTVLVTAGAEYSNQEYISVSTDSHNLGAPSVSVTSGRLSLIHNEKAAQMYQLPFCLLK